ncbi:GNAT family N-acetyltransferase [Vallitalea guaymasensis]|uniref:GNAT family N-acetyltransferase n=1 Tax=Vallitalea guaymasensis TaxID=1185412 RepID=UPI00235733DA|nr:GNAT family N-acetyltransferase [Vallitalea guaymasensis]
MYNLNELKIRNFETEDESNISEIFLDGFYSKVKNLIDLPDEHKIDFLRDFGILGAEYKEGHFIAEVDGDIIGLMLLRWVGQRKQNSRQLKFSQLVKKYGFIPTIKTMAKIIILNHDPKKGEIYIEHIAVSEKARGLGIGSILIEKAFNTAKSMKDIHKVGLAVIEENNRAHKLYKRLGFQDVRKITTSLGKWAVGVYQYTEMEKAITD